MFAFREGKRHAAYLTNIGVQLKASGLARFPQAASCKAIQKDSPPAIVILEAATLTSASKCSGLTRLQHSTWSTETASANGPHLD